MFADLFFGIEVLHICEDLAPVSLVCRRSSVRQRVLMLLSSVFCVTSGHRV
jgi:hypothetical protein